MEDLEKGWWIKNSVKKNKCSHSVVQSLVREREDAEEVLMVMNDLILVPDWEILKEMGCVQKAVLLKNVDEEVEHFWIIYGWFKYESNMNQILVLYVKWNNWANMIL